MAPVGKESKGKSEDALPCACFRNAINKLSSANPNVLESSQYTEPEPPESGCIFCNSAANRPQWSLVTPQRQYHLPVQETGCGWRFWKVESCCFWALSLSGSLACFCSLVCFDSVCSCGCSIKSAVGSCNAIPAPQVKTMLNRIFSRLHTNDQPFSAEEKQQLADNFELQLSDVQLLIDSLTFMIHTVCFSFQTSQASHRNAFCFCCGFCFVVVFALF